MTITKTKNGNAVTLTLDGSLDALTAPELQKELEVIDENTESLMFDLEKLQYISSAGLRVLLTAQKVMNRQGTMIVRNASEDVKEIFDVTGFSDILTIE